MAGGYPHVLGEQELFHLADLPLQVFLIGGCNRDQQVHKVKIFIVGKPFLEEIAAADGAVDIIKVRVGIAGVLDPGAVDEIQRFGESLAENNTATMVQFMCKNIALVEAYWEIKRYISRDSYWFRNTQKYQKWHLTDSIETSTALRTGTILRSKAEHDYWWFENEIFSINRKCIMYLCKTSNYSSLYTYLSCFDTIYEIAIDSNEVNYLVNQINYLREFVEKLATDTERQDDEENKVFAGIVEQISLLYLDIVLESSKYCKNFDIKKIISNTITVIDKGKPLDKCELFRGKEQLDFYNKIITEIQVEKRRLTPDWLIAQNVAREAHLYINILIDVIQEGIDN